MWMLRTLFKLYYVIYNGIKRQDGLYSNAPDDLARMCREYFIFEREIVRDIHITYLNIRK